MEFFFFCLTESILFCDFCFQIRINSQETLLQFKRSLLSLPLRSKLISGFTNLNVIERNYMTLRSSEPTTAVPHKHIRVHALVEEINNYTLSNSGWTEDIQSSSQTVSTNLHQHFNLGRLLLTGYLILSPKSNNNNLLIGANCLWINEINKYIGINQRSVFWKCDLHPYNWLIF